MHHLLHSLPALSYSAARLMLSPALAPWPSVAAKIFPTCGGAPKLKPSNQFHIPKGDWSALLTPHAPRPVTHTLHMHTHNLRGCRALIHGACAPAAAPPRLFIPRAPHTISAAQETMHALLTWIFTVAPDTGRCNRVRVC